MKEKGNLVLKSNYLAHHILWSSQTDRHQSLQSVIWCSLFIIHLSFLHVRSPCVSKFLFILLFIICVYPRLCTPSLCLFGVEIFSINTRGATKDWSCKERCPLCYVHFSLTSPSLGIFLGQGDLSFLNFTSAIIDLLKK